MCSRPLSWSGLGILAVSLLLGSPLGSYGATTTETVLVPEADQFSPFALTIHVGEKVKWVNNDTDDHTVVSDDSVNTTGPKQLDHLLPGTDSNGGKPGKFSIVFRKPGTFVYHCRFHSILDANHQPVAPGPEGGIQGEGVAPPGTADDFGTPMMGVITVLPSE